MVDGLSVTLAGLLDAGATGVLILVVLMVLTGRLVPRRSVDDVRADRDARLAAHQAEIERWRGAYEESEAARRSFEDTANGNLASTRMVAHLVRELRTLPGGEDA